MDNTIFKHLNTKQKDAVLHADGPSIILAGAGSGKTRVLIHKVLHLINNNNVAPDSILMITFTNKAANEMKERIAHALVSQKYNGIGYVGTFHSFCAMVLRRQSQHLGIDNKFSIYDGDDQSTVIRRILRDLDIKKFTPSYFLNRISSAKNQLIPPERYLSIFADYGAALAAQVYDQYEKDLRKNNALDFDDLIMKTIEIFIKNQQVLDMYQERYRYIMVDEFQDTNVAQYNLARLLGSKYKNITVVGDFSQSIYSWRGADIRNLEKFDEDFPGTATYHLEQNYRSSQKILDFAYDVISKNQTHPVLHLFTENEAGKDVIINQSENEQDEAIYVVREIESLKNSSTPFSSFAVLYRTNAQSRVLEEAFLHYGIPYMLIGGTRFYERKEIKDILSYLRLFINPNDEIASERIKKLGKRKWDSFRALYQEIGLSEAYKDISTVEIMEKIFEKTGYLDMYDIHDEEDYARLENIKELKSVAIRFSDIVTFLEQVALVESEYFEGEKKGGAREGVRLMTLHQAKGLEFPFVFIVGLEEGILPHSRAIDDIFELEEERRLFYVGITRAREKLYITFTKRRFIFGRRNEAMRSRFLGQEEKDPTDIW